SFPIYADGSKTIPARSSTVGMQDGIDLVNALASNRNTGIYLATKLYRFFINEGGDDNAWIDRIANVYQQSGYAMRAVVRAILVSDEFWNSQYKRYAWPVEVVVRGMKDFGWQGFSLNSTLTPLNNMGQNLFEPPDVHGWDLGESWFSSGATLARVNFAATLAQNQRFNLATAARTIPNITSGATGAQTLLSGVLGLAQVPPYDPAVSAELATYLTSTGAWTGSQTQLQNKVSGL